VLDDGLVDPRRELGGDLDLHLLRPHSRGSGDELLHLFSHGDRHGVDRHGVRVQAREVEELVDEPAKPLGLTAQGLTQLDAIALLQPVP